MYIGEVSKKTGLSVKAIRLYEEKGLIPVPKRLGAYRVYQASDLDILVLIKEARALDISLTQLKSVIVFKNGQVDWNKMEAFLLQHKSRLAQEIEILKEKMILIDQCVSQIHRWDFSIDSPPGTEFTLHDFPRR